MMLVQFAFAALLGVAQCRNKQQPIVLQPPGIDQPPIGFGTWNLKESPENTTNAVAFAIEKGYRQIDGAAAYGNEEAVGKGIQKGLKQAGLKREDIWVTSKLWNDQYAHPAFYSKPPANFPQSCSRSRRSRPEQDFVRPRPRLPRSLPHALARRQRPQRQGVRLRLRLDMALHEFASHVR